MTTSRANASPPRSACRGRCIPRPGPSWRPRYKPGEFNAARQRMATMPRGATLIETTATIAPGFTHRQRARHGRRAAHHAGEVRESGADAGGRAADRVARGICARHCRKARIAEGLAAIQARYPALDIGSYPFYRPTGGGVAIVAKGTDGAAAEAADRRGHGPDDRAGGQPGARRAAGRLRRARLNARGGAAYPTAVQHARRCILCP